MDRLIEGYRRFRSETWPAERARYEVLAKRGQRPETLVISCSDSRVDPQTIFGAVPGELFVIRNVAGLVPPFQPDSGYHGTSAAMEFAVRVLKVARIVVVGHAQCGGVQAMVEGAPRDARDFVEPWMAMAQPALRSPPAGLSPQEMLLHYEKEIVRISLENLMTFPWVAERVADGSLQMAGFHFGIATGVLARLEGDRLVPVV